VFENLIYDVCYNHVWPNFVLTLYYSIYTVSIIYTHGTGSIFNVLKNSLQDVFILTLQIYLTTFFFILKLLYFVNPLPKKECHISVNSVEDRGQREWASGVGNPLVSSSAQFVNKRNPYSYYHIF
jgi:hypothetical protein